MAFYGVIMAVMYVVDACTCLLQMFQSKSRKAFKMWNCACTRPGPTNTVIGLCLLYSVAMLLVSYCLSMYNFVHVISENESG